MLAEREIVFAGQAIGLIVAEDRLTALRAAALVNVNYSNIQKPILTIDQALVKAKNEGYYEKVFGKTTKSDKGDLKLHFLSIVEKKSFFFIMDLRSPNESLMLKR